MAKYAQKETKYMETYGKYTASDVGELRKHIGLVEFRPDHRGGDKYAYGKYADKGEARGRRLFQPQLFGLPEVPTRPSTGPYALVLGGEPSEVREFYVADTVMTVKEAEPVPETEMTKFKPGDNYATLSQAYDEVYVFTDIHAAERIYMDVPIEAPQEYLDIRGSLSPIAIHSPMATSVESIYKYGPEGPIKPPEGDEKPPEGHKGCFDIAPKMCWQRKVDFFAELAGPRFEADPWKPGPMALRALKDLCHKDEFMAPQCMKTCDMCPPEEGEKRK